MTTPTTTKNLSKPFSITLCGPGIPTIQEMACHIRDGYYPNPDMPLDVIGGIISVNLILGNPDQSSYSKAKESKELSLQLEQAAYQKDVEEAAKRMLQQQEAEATRKQIAAEIKIHQDKIFSLQKSADKATK